MAILEKLFRMDGRVVVVNGGAGRIGSQMCLAIADAGAKSGSLGFVLPLPTPDELESL